MPNQAGHREPDIWAIQCNCWLGVLIFFVI
jgi:hypothetical protein